MKACSHCKRIKPVSEFWIERRRNKPKSICKKCSVIKAREWREKNPDAGKERYQKEKLQVRERHLLRKYGMSLTQYEKLLSSQGRKCAICGKTELSQYKSVLHVDHCHKTGAIRGLLCRGCNHILGTVDDDPEILLKAIAYLLK